MVALNLQLFKCCPSSNFQSIYIVSKYGYSFTTASWSCLL